VSAWRSNAWLFGLGAGLAGLAALGADRLVALALALYVRLPMLEPVFRADHERQIRALHPLVAAVGLFAIVAYVLTSWRELEVWAWLLGAAGGSTSDRVRTSAVAILVLYAVLLIPVRATRDVLREGDLWGLSVEQRRLRLYGVHTREPDYRPIEAFRLSARGQGALLVVRHGREPSFDDVFLASYLFPRRVFVHHVPDCVRAVQPLLRAERPDARWIEWACADGRFAPEPIEP